jgi:hypothetical protein
VRYKHKLAFFQYMRKRSRWQELFQFIDSIVQKPVNFDRAKIERQTSTVSLTGMKESQDSDKVDESKLTLKPLETESKAAIVSKMLAVFAMVWALIVLTTEATLIVDPAYTLLNFLVKSEGNAVSTLILSVVFLSGITLCCFFTIFNLKLSDYLQLKDEQTDCIQMASITGICAKIINVVIYNYMVICGEIQRGVPFAE